MKGLDGLEAATDRDDRHTAGARQPRDPGRRLTAQGLGVHPPLARHNRRRAGDEISKPARLHEDIDAWSQGGLTRQQQRSTEATGGAGAGCHGDPPTTLVFEKLEELGERLVQRTDVRRPRAFLWAEHRSCTLRSAQRVIDVTSDLDLGFRQAGIKRGPVCCGDVGQLPAGDDGWQCIAVPVQKAHAQRL